MSDIKIEICSVAVESSVITFPDKRTGEKKTMDKDLQQAYLHTGGQYPLPFKIQLQDRNKPYAIGEYTLSTESFRVGKYGDLETSRHLKLIPLAPASISKSR